MIVAGALAGEAAYLAGQLVGGEIGTAAFVRVIVGSLAGIVVYVMVLLALRAPELDVVRRRFGRPAPIGASPGAP